MQKLPQLPFSDSCGSDSSHMFLKIEVRLVLTGGVHTGGQHMPGGMILPEAFGRHPPQIPALQAPRQSGGKGLGAVAVTGIGGSDAAAQLRAAPPVKVIEHSLADQLPVQADGEVHRLPAAEILARDGKEVVLCQLTHQILAIVVPPPAVALVVKAEGVVSVPVLVAQLRERQTLRLDRRNLTQGLEFVGDLEAHLAREKRGEILELRGAQAAVRCVVLAVDPRAAIRVVPCTIVG